MASQELIARLRERWRDLDLVSAGCDACAPVGQRYERDGMGLGHDLEPRIVVIDRPSESHRVRECRTCGALFQETWEGPPAADDLFAITTVLERISAKRALELMRAWTDS